MDNQLDALNPQQRAAVEYCDGPQLVIAGAGSGKTRVLTHKIVYLLGLGYEPWRIMALTFTNKAAREMRDRIESLSGVHTARRLWMGTFHSIFARLLRGHADRIGYSSNYTIYDAADSRVLIKSIIKSLGLDEKIYKPAAVASAISTAKNALLSPEDYRRDRELMEADRRARRGDLQEIYRIYRDRCVAAQAMDFDDLLYNTYRLLRENPDLCHHYREFFRYILVDEYQDTNYAQHAIISLLTGGEAGCGLSVVGDDAQSIYSFRGANIRNILTLQNVYPTLKVFKLEQNYRSTQNIIDAANSLIEKNEHQIKKRVFSTNSRGNLIDVVMSWSDYEEAGLVANSISRVKLESGESFGDFAILYRTNAQSRILEESLRKRNIPYRIYGGLSFYQRKEVKDAIAYFRLALNPDDDEALRRVINIPRRSIGETTINKLTAAAMAHNVSIWQVLNDPVACKDCGLNSGTIRKLNDFASVISGFNTLVTQEKPADEIAVTIIERTGLMAQYISDHTPESISKRENLDELLSGVKLYVAEAQEEGNDDVTLGRFMGEVSLATDQDSQGEENNGESVTLMTMHAAKGLEFNNVYIVGVEEDLVPSSMSSDSFEGVEEERRLLYVAITRARKRCMLSYASSRFRNGQTCTCSPSRFLRDIDPGYLHPISGTTLSTTTAPWLSHYSSKAMTSTGGLRNIGQSGNTAGISAPLRQIGGHSSVSQSVGRSNGSFRTVTSTDLAEGMRIAHKTFGAGTVLEIDTTKADHRIIVDFDNTGQKTLLLKFARIQIL